MKALLVCLLAAILALAACQETSPTTTEASAAPVRIHLEFGSDLPPDIRTKTDSIVVFVEAADGTARQLSWRPKEDTLPPLHFPMNLGLDITASGYDSAGDVLWQASGSVAGQINSNAQAIDIALVAHQLEDKAAPIMTGAVEPVLASASSGIYHTPFALVLGTTTPGASLHYTTDGTYPGPGSPVYKDSIRIETTTSISVVALHSGYFPSQLRKLSYRLVAATPVPSHRDSADSIPFPLRLSCMTPNSVIRYRTDGGIPDTSSPTFPETLHIATRSSSIRARAFAPGFEPSNIMLRTWTIAPPPPRISGAGVVSRADGSRRILLSHPDSSVRIHVTTDGSDPDTNAPRISSPLVLTRNCRVRSIGWSPSYGFTAALDTTFAFTTDPGAFTLRQGTYGHRVPLSIVGNTAGSILRYTLDSTNPTQASPAFPDTFWITKPTALRVKAFRDGWTTHDSALKGSWSLQPGAIVWSTPPGLVYRKGVLNAISEGGNARLYATTDGSTPTTASTPFASITIDSASTAGGLRVRVLAILPDGLEGFETRSEGTWTWAGGSLHDSRDGRTYRTIRNIAFEWMAQDLAWDSGDSSLCFPDSAGGCNAGRFYQASHALAGADSCATGTCDGPHGICPEGWRLPSYTEWQLMRSLNDSMSRGTWDVSAPFLDVGAPKADGSIPDWARKYHWAWYRENKSIVISTSAEKNASGMIGRLLPIRCLR